ncbi:DUF222 domain-containing protein [Kocuria coralli]|uniref:DUF222 domain-containing protein n=1 Tax=Kocuria coralli TaxID=1461025 RepID=A0A5J5KY89_9MICC|nr:HNH endonuclease signature motif containing protein [Kocuria coralli]KAA9394639.1 DUF222 domain-containing protein [Kocuria coralli]
MAGIQQMVRAEASARGRLLRLIAGLYEEARARHGEQAQQEPAATLAQGSSDLVLRDVAAEISVALMLPAGTARATVAEALIFAGDLPVALAALEDGEITWGQARVILAHWQALTEQAPTRRALRTLTGDVLERAQEEAADLEHKATVLVEDLLARAPHVTTAQLSNYARRRRAGLGAAAAQRACNAARRRRDVWVSPDDDGLAYLTALLDAPTATAIGARIRHLAGTLDDAAPGEGQQLDRHSDPDLQDRPGSGIWMEEHRSMGEKRADVLADLLLDGELPESSGIARGIRGQVSIMVPATGVLAHDPDLDEALAGGIEDPGYGDQPAHLVGYGPIAVEDALRIAAGAPSWKRVLTDPDTGVITCYGRSTYPVPAGLRRLLAVRDETCRFPGCRRQAAGCDIDHTVAWENGGTTDAGNLEHLCRHHHRVKHSAGALGSWAVRHVNPAVETGRIPAGERSPGVLEWVSPTGVVRRSVPGAATPVTTRWLEPRSPVKISGRVQARADLPPPF